MSISSITSTITRLQKEISTIAAKVSQETKKEVALYSRINQIQRSITKSTSASSLSSKLSEIERKQKEIATISVAKAALAKKESDKNAALLKARQELAKEEEKERKRIASAKERELKKEIELEKQRQRAQLEFQRNLNAELSATSALSRKIESMTPQHQEPEIAYDLFISHASEDKEDLVRPLAVALEKLGVKVWYDEFTLKVGDSLRRSIDKKTATAMWRMLQSRLRRGRVYQGYTTSTPEGFGFLYEFFAKNASKDDRHYIQASTYDNPFLPEEFIISLKENYPPELIEAYLEGKFVNLTSGQIYHKFDRRLNHVDFTIDDIIRANVGKTDIYGRNLPLPTLHIGMDFNINKMAAIVHVIDNDGPVAIDEIIDARDTEEMVNIIKERYPQFTIAVYPDSSDTHLS